MASPIIEDIAAFEDQHRYGCLTDLEFAAAVAGVLVRTNDAAGHPAWLTAVATEVAQLDAEWKREQLDRHSIPIRGGRILPSRWLAGVFCASSVVGIPLFAVLAWPALEALADRFLEAGWQTWAPLVFLVLLPTVFFPTLVYWWAVQFERAEADFLSRRAAIILEALRRRTEGSGSLK